MRTVQSAEILERIKSALVDLKLFEIKELLEEEMDRLGNNAGLISLDAL